jgi:RNA polymerase sigma-70 factor (ECF subfamily)
MGMITAITNRGVITVIRHPLTGTDMTMAGIMMTIRQNPLAELVILGIGNASARQSVGPTALAGPGCGALTGSVTMMLAVSAIDVMDAISNTGIALPANSQSNQELDRFFASHEENAYYVAYAALWHHETAMDVVQDSMLRLVEYYRDKPPGQWPALFRTILNSRINDVRRRRLIEQGKHKLVSFTGLFRKDRDDGNTMEESDLPADVRDDHITAPEAGMVAAQLRQKGFDALQYLSGNAVRAREWRGMTTQKRLTLGCSENSVKQHHFRALRDYATSSGGMTIMNRHILMQNCLTACVPAADDNIDAKARLENHLAACPRCRGQLHAWEHLGLDALGAWPVPEGKLSADLKQARQRAMTAGRHRRIRYPVRDCRHAAIAVGRTLTLRHEFMDTPQMTVRTTEESGSLKTSIFICDGQSGRGQDA